MIATFITKTLLSTLMWDKNSVTYCWHYRHVFLFRNLHVAGLYLDLDLDLGLGLCLGVLASFNISGTPPPSVWPHQFCGTGQTHEKRKGEQLKWSLAFSLYIGSFSVHTARLGRLCFFVYFA